MGEQVFAGEYERLPWLHIYAQGQWHGDASIVGTREALKGLRDAIDKCLLTGMDAEAEGIVRDGEGFRVRVAVRSMDALAGMPVPYTEDYARAAP